MSGLYRSDAAHERIQDWCRTRLESWDRPHESTFVDTHVGPIHVLRAGAGPRTVVYLPGTNFNAATSLAVIGSVMETCEVFVLDLPGQPGLSSPARPKQSASAGPSWVSQVLQELRTADMQRVILVGHSRGAADAMSATPSQADGIALLNPAGLARVRITASLLRSTLPWMLRPTSERARTLLRLMSAPGFEPSSDLVEWLTMVARETRTTGAPPPVPRDWTDRWTSHPTLVLCGQHDVFFPASKISPAARARLEAQVNEIEGVGHLSVEEAPETVAGHLSRFMDSIG